MDKDNRAEEIDAFMQAAKLAFEQYKKMPLQKRADFMYAIGKELERSRWKLVQSAFVETHLPEKRLDSELTRTIFQLTSYADNCVSGQWLEARIDHGNNERIPPKPDIRKMLVPLGPVVVFGAANFPFAYSTAGGDTASAFAAGCPVIVKAHPGHLDTSKLVADAILSAASETSMPDGIFAHVIGNSNSTGELLVKHKETKAVGFTGSFAGGKQLFDWGNQRDTPVPVFAEMSSVNPVFILPGKMEQDVESLASTLIASITLNAGQFCTNPGIIIVTDHEKLETFTNLISAGIKQTDPEDMLNEGIHKNYIDKKAMAISQAEVEIVSVSGRDAGIDEGMAIVTTVPASVFITNPILQKEVFGPYSILVKCRDMNEMLEVARSMEGQLTASLMATADDMNRYQSLIETVKDFCGRLILNGVPTGVEVCLSMQHGRPFPSTTDSRYTSVGADAIKRFARPLAFQNCPDEFLPPELRERNPLNIWRTVDNELMK